MNPAIGKILAVLKPVHEAEIFANRLFKILDMPTPHFAIIDKSHFNKSINDTVEASLHTSAAASDKMMVMEPVLGRAMSEYNAEELKNLLLNEENLELLGRCMVFDTFTGNADRIVPFSANIINPDNIMFQDGSVTFIDQASKPRSSQIIRIFTKMASVVQPDPGLQNNSTNVYDTYTLRLVERSLQKYEQKTLKHERDLAIENHSFEKFKSLIDTNHKVKINLLLTAGICNGVQKLMSKKEKILEECGENEHMKKAINEIYAGLVGLSVIFKEIKSS